MPSLHEKIKALNSYSDHSLNTLVALAEINETDIAALEASLTEKGIKVGDFIGAGGTAIIFELENKDGKKIESAVLRIEAKGISGNSKHPFVLQPITSVESADHVAHIMPRAEKLESAPSSRAAALTLAALNSNGVLPQAWDLRPDALMQLRKPGGELVRYSDNTPVLIVADSNAVGSIAQDTERDHIATIARAFNLDAEKVRKNKLKHEVVDAVAIQMDEVYSNVRKDIKDAGIVADEVQQRSWQTRTSNRTGQSLG